MSDEGSQLDLEKFTDDSSSYIFHTSSMAKRAIEDDFPFEELSKIAKRESWRKEIYRPPYYLHKWWGRRLGSIFRALIIGGSVPNTEDILELFYQPVRLPDTTIYDPMMGSGVTVGESVKLGAKTIGRDINPVAVQTAKSALMEVSKEKVNGEFKKIENDVSDEIKTWYKSKINGETVDVLYYFWVKTISCPECGFDVDLFKNRIFSKHAYPNKHPEAKALCPTCGSINDVLNSDEVTKCDACDTEYNPQEGPARRTRATCPECEHDFRIIDAIQSQEEPPNHRMYAKMVLTDDDEKKYKEITEYDKELYEETSSKLDELDLPIPQVRINSGNNTDQIINYNYRYWDQLFNQRQLLVLGLLAQRIGEISDPQLRELFTTFLSGVIEFNSMLCSFKGEGTGAVRHTFSHHTFKPEKTPLEANLWGTPKSSGSFSTLFKSRLMRAIEYKNEPFELALDADNSSEKIFGINQNLNKNIVSSYSKFKNDSDCVYLSAGDSSSTDIATDSVNLVITDPPFFDNVHYSELADFFFVWQNAIHGNDSTDTTRSDKEVQQTNADEFSSNLSTVFNECQRVLQDDGLLIFTYHHSRSEGWYSILRALRKSGFYIQTIYPIKSEMSVGVPKSQAESPINVDIIFVCRSFTENILCEKSDVDDIDKCISESKEMVNRFDKANIDLSLNDIRAIMIANLLIGYSKVSNLKEGINDLRESQSLIENKAEVMFNSL